LLTLIFDAYVFTQSFIETIEEHPTLIYLTALPFTPVTSRIYQIFHNINTMPRVAGGFEQSWSPRRLVLNHIDHVACLAFSCDGDRIVTGSSDIWMWNAISGAEVIHHFSAISNHNIIFSISFSKDGSRIASGCMDQHVHVWNTVSGQRVFPQMEGHKKNVLSVRFSPDGMKIVSGSEDGTIRIWDAITGAASLPKICGHSDHVTSVAFSPDGTRIVSGSRDKAVRFWDPNTGENVAPFQKTHTDEVLCVAISSNGAWLASCSKDIFLWDAMTGAKIAPPLRGHKSYILSIAFSPNGRHIVSGSSDKTVRVWDVLSGAEILSPFLHNLPVREVTYSPDGTRIASASVDGTVRVWDVTKPVNVSLMKSGHEDHISVLTFSDDGKYVATGSWDQTVRVWDASTGGQICPPFTGHTGILLRSPSLPMELGLHQVHMSCILGRLYPRSWSVPYQISTSLECHHWLSRGMALALRQVCWIFVFGIYCRGLKSFNHFAAISDG
jgi:WD40 repeat protein